MTEENKPAPNQTDAPLRVLQLNVGGMHCSNCATLVEQRLAKLAPVRSVSVAYRSRRATVTYAGGLELRDLQKVVADDGFTLLFADAARPPISGNTPRDYLEIAAAFAILVGLVFTLKHFALLPHGISVSDVCRAGSQCGSHVLRLRQAPLRGRNQRRSAMAYVDGFVVAVPKKNLAAYKKMALAAGKVWMEHGALEFRECVADDVKVGKLTSFPQAVKLKPGEVVVFSYIVYKNRATRDKVNKKVMADPRLNDMMAGKDMPFDGKRMIFGGFETLVELSA